MIKTLFALFILLLPQLVLSTSSYNTSSCDYLTGSQARTHCYDAVTKTVPVRSSALQEGQKLIDTYRCGRRLLHIDMSVAEVMNLCPKSQQPSNIELYTQTFEVHHRGYYGYHYISIETNQMEKWTFKQYGRFRTYLIFRDGILYQIIQDKIRN